MNDGEANADDRLLIAAQGQLAQWFAKDVKIDCHKGLWRWDESRDAVIFREGNQSRFHCEGFHRHLPGRSPQQHLALEDERRAFSRQVWVALLPFIGGLLGALIGAWVALRRH